MSLTARQQRFVDAYLLDPNATQAAITAGYSAKTAHVQGPRQLGKVRVQTALWEARKAVSKQLVVTQEWLVNEFWENHLLAREGNPLLDRYGKPTGAVMRQISASNKALEAIAVITGHWVNKTRVGVDSDLAALMERIDGKSRGLNIESKPPAPRLVSRPVSDLEDTIVDEQGRVYEVAGQIATPNATQEPDIIWERNENKDLSGDDD